MNWLLITIIVCLIVGIIIVSAFFLACYYGYRKAMREESSCPALILEKEKRGKNYE